MRREAIVHQGAGNVLLVAAVCILSSLAYVYGLGTLIGWQLPQSLFNFLQEWWPRDHRNYVEQVIISPRYDLSFQDGVVWAIAILSIGTFLFQGVALSLTVAWFRWIHRPDVWRTADRTRRRRAMLQALWQPLLWLTVTMAVADLIWVNFFRVWQAWDSHRGVVLGGGLRTMYVRWVPLMRDPTPIVLDMGDLAAWLSWLSVLVIQALLTARILVRALPRPAVEIGRRCSRCGYPLRNPATAICPECGCIESQLATRHFARIRNFAARCWNKRIVLLWLVPFLMLLAPILLPLIQILSGQVMKLLHA